MRGSNSRSVLPFILSYQLIATVMNMSPPFPLPRTNFPPRIAYQFPLHYDFKYLGRDEIGPFVGSVGNVIEVCDAEGRRLCSEGDVGGQVGRCTLTASMSCIEETWSLSQKRARLENGFRIKDSSSVTFSLM